MNNNLYETMQQYGYQAPEHIPVGKLVRFPAPNKPASNRSAWVNLQQGTNGRYAHFGDWITGEKYLWQETTYDQSTLPHQLKSNNMRHQNQIACNRQISPMSSMSTMSTMSKTAIEQQLEQKRYNTLKKIQLAEQRVESLMQFARPVTDALTHPYLVKKQVYSYGLFQIDYVKGITEQYLYCIRNALLVPVQSFYAETGAYYQSLQIIAPNGTKRFLKGGVLENGYYCIRQPNRAIHNRIFVCEGYATGATLAQLMPDASIFCAFNCGNLLKVATSIRANYPEHPIIIAGDNDHQKENSSPQGNIGKKKAIEAAKAVGGSIFIPEFLSHETGSDWNDYFTHQRATI
jgi:phage/plasmid primase-like uncharacterized protein